MDPGCAKGRKTRRGANGKRKKKAEEDKEPPGRRRRERNLRKGSPAEEPESISNEYGKFSVFLGVMVQILPARGYLTCRRIKGAI